MSATISNKIKYIAGYQLFNGATVKIILMQSGFTFDRDSHHGYADVSASELATAYGYTAGGATLAGININEDDTDDRCEVTWNNPAWTASGGDLEACSAIIYISGTIAGQADPLVQHIDFGGDLTVYDGGVFTVANPEIRLT